MLLKAIFPLLIFPAFSEVLFSDECRKLYGLWACSDCNECQTLDSCTDEEAQYRAGFLCHEWPFFNGIGFTYLPVEDKHISCARQNHTTCLEWEERKESSAELAVTDCTCKDYITEGNSDYCKNWGCKGIGLAKCRGDDNDCGVTHQIGSITFTEDCCGYRSCGDGCTEGVQYKKTIRDEFQNCTCIRPLVREAVGNKVTTFCDHWECLDWSDTAGYNYLEYETHTCSRRNVDYGYCEKWNWDTDDHDSFENTACHCMDTMSTNTTGVACQRFECSEKGAEKIAPNLLWAFWGVTFIPHFVLGLWSSIFQFSVLCDNGDMIDLFADAKKYMRTGECSRALAVGVALHSTGGVLASLLGGGIGAFVIELCGVFVILLCSWVVWKLAEMQKVTSVDEADAAAGQPTDNGYDAHEVGVNSRQHKYAATGHVDMNISETL